MVEGDALGGMEVLDKGWVRLMTPSLGAVWDEAHARSPSRSLSLTLARARVSSLSLFLFPPSLLIRQLLSRFPC